MLADIVFHVVKGPIQRVIARNIITIQEQKREFTFLQRFDVDFDIAISNPLHGFNTQLVLIDGEHIFISEDFFGGLTHAAQIIPRD